MWKRWWLFHATDFQSLMYPCFTIGRILGMFPYKINASTFEASKPYYILSTVIICVCFVFDLLLIQVFFTKINLESMTRTLEAVSFYTFSGFIMIITHILSGPRMRLLQRILEISSKVPSESYQKLSRLIHFKDIFCTIFLVVLTCVYYLKHIKTELFEVNCITALIFLLTTYLSLLEFHINMLYMNCVCVLKACLKRINENVAHVQKLTKNDTKPYVPQLICRISGNQGLLMKLKSLKKQHLMVIDAVKMLNIIFSPQLLAAIVIIFTNITFELYFCVVRWQDGLLISFDLNYFDVFLISLTFYVIKITLIVWTCETGKNQAQELGTTIHDALNSTSDEQIKHELQLFSLQLLHWENAFSAKGLTVDAKFLATMVGNITTYMLILVQFLIASHSCDEKFGNNITNNSFT